MFSTHVFGYLMIAWVGLGFAALAGFAGWGTRGLRVAGLIYVSAFCLLAALLAK